MTFEERKAPPHTRGYTLNADPYTHSTKGSPAHARIHPMSHYDNQGRRRLPRTRGDTPTRIRLT